MTSSRLLTVLLTTALLLAGCSDGALDPAPSAISSVAPTQSPTPAKTPSRAPAASPPSSLDPTPTAPQAEGVIACLLIGVLADAAEADDQAAFDRRLRELEELTPKVQDAPLREALGRFLQALEAQDEEEFMSSIREVRAACATLKNRR